MTEPSAVALPDADHGAALLLDALGPGRPAQDREHSGQPHRSEERFPEIRHVQPPGIRMGIGIADAEIKKSRRRAWRRPSITARPWSKGGFHPAERRPEGGRR